ncbi:hypothetical protein XU18_3016 [Perkinsela sp. CCAP 1560/4]|nr:hypothetical protein XU18_3016 [Perkinsela sp. CCAP 1560/4]|eukprot:KNH06079.1 hypothetical protein XU18_3016 [Perkinsela sp. CCAP 1560/4]
MSSRLLMRISRPTYSALFQFNCAKYCVGIKVPFIAESINSGKIGRWSKKVGDYIKEDEEVCDIESDKLTVSVKAPTSGKITQITAVEGQEVEVGLEIARLQEGEVKQAESSEKAKAEQTSTPKSSAKPESVETKAEPKPAPATSAPVKQNVASVVATGDCRIRREKTSLMRQRIADRLKASQNTAAMLTTFNEIDMHNLITLREKHKEEFLKKHGVKLGFMSAFARASALAIQEVPIINASWDDDYITYHDYVDISVAVATPSGLVVPVLRDVQEMSFIDIEKKIVEFGTKAKNRKLSIAEMSGGTFTISNGGVFGSWLGTPIINPPQSAILGMHATKKKPWVDEKGNIVVRPIMAVALTYDHRLIDGREAVTFLGKIKKLIEDPSRMLFSLA